MGNNMESNSDIKLESKLENGIDTNLHNFNREIVSKCNEDNIEGIEFLTPEFLIDAYSKGYFPMYEEDYNAVLWHNPNPRAIFDLFDPKPMPKSLAKTARKNLFTIQIDKQFETVMRKCADREETWIIEKMIEVYTELHNLGYAHSVEVYTPDEQLVGGLYGIAIGGAFFGESMFNTVPDASKYALFQLIEHLQAREFILLDSQYLNSHTRSLGAINIPSSQFKRMLRDALKLDVSFK